MARKCLHPVEKGNYVVEYCQLEENHEEKEHNTNPQRDKRTFKQCAEERIKPVPVVADHRATNPAYWPGGKIPNGK